MNPLEILLERGEVTEALSREVEQLMAESKVSLEAALLKKGIAREVVRKLFAEYYKVPPFEIPEGFNIKEEVLAYVPEESAIHYRLIPLNIEDEVLMVGVNDPEDLQLREVLNFVSSKHNIAYKVLFYVGGGYSQGA